MSWAKEEDEEEEEEEEDGGGVSWSDIIPWPG